MPEMHQDAGLRQKKSAWEVEDRLDERITETVKKNTGLPPGAKAWLSKGPCPGGAENIRLVTGNIVPPGASRLTRRKKRADAMEERSSSDNFMFSIGNVGTKIPFSQQMERRTCIHTKHECPPSPITLQVCIKWEISMQAVVNPIASIG